MEQQPQEILTRPKSADGRVQLLPPWVNIDAYDIEEVLGGVHGVSVRGLGFIKEFGAQVRDVFGGSVNGIEQEYEKAYADSVTKLRSEAVNLKADTVLDFKVEQDLVIDPETKRIMIQSIADGVAVKLRDRKLVDKS